MLKEKIQADQLAALKSGEKEKLDTLRYIMAQMKNREIDKHAPLTDEDVVALLRKQVKELQESIDAFEKGGRTDLTGLYKKQKDIVASYLPAELSEEDLRAEIKKVVDAHQDVLAKDPKAIIGLAVKELRSKSDPSRIARIASSFIS